MKKVVIIALFLIFLTACSSSQKNTSSGTPDGLHITFLESQPRSELREKEYFDVGLKLENKAECDIKGEVCIRDTLTESISGIRDDCQPFNLRGKDQNNIDSENIYFTDNSYESIPGDLTSNIIAKAEYSCSIILTPQACVKPSIEDEKICKTKETLSPSTLGLKSAPITVVKIDKILIPQKDAINLEVAIHLKKMAEGLSNSFNINVEYEGYGLLNCRDLDRLDFETSTENIINCEIPVNVDDIEENPLKIGLNYIYETSKSKQIKITKEGDK